MLKLTPDALDELEPISIDGSENVPALEAALIFESVSASSASCLADIGVGSEVLPATGLSIIGSWEIISSLS